MGSFKALDASPLQITVKNFTIPHAVSGLYLFEDEIFCSQDVCRNGYGCLIYADLTKKTHETEAYQKGVTGK